MKISKVLFDEITKLSKSEWDRLKTNIDFLYSSELRQAEKKFYLSPAAKAKLVHCPHPIEIEDKKEEVNE